MFKCSHLDPQQLERLPPTPNQPSYCPFNLIQGYSTDYIDRARASATAFESRHALLNMQQPSHTAETSLMRMNHLPSSISGDRLSHLCYHQNVQPEHQPESTAGTPFGRVTSESFLATFDDSYSSETGTNQFPTIRGQPQTLMPVDNIHLVCLSHVKCPVL